jgi:glyoxylase-like metal-dependent hydrolase (beta-lactamase superfamily II)
MTTLLKSASATAFAAALLVAPTHLASQSPSPTALVQNAAAAMGGADALRALGNVTIEFHSANFGLGQEETPSSPARATFTFGRVITDYRAGRRLTTQELRPVAGAVQRQRVVVTPTVALAVVNDVQAPTNPGAVIAVAAEIRAQPERMILAALDNPGQLSAVAPRQFRGEMMDGVRMGTGATAPTLWFDRLSRLLVAIERVADDPILGDRRTVTLYTRWQDAGGVQLPREIDVEVNGRLQQHTVVTSASINAVLSDVEFAIPDSIVRSAPPLPSGPPPIVVTLAELGPGVWRAEGGSHHSLVIRQGNALVVVEAPQSTARSRAVLDTLRSRFPGVPVRTLIPSHHHSDHSGGIREYLASGTEVLVHPRNVDFVRGIGAAAKTIAPDALTRGGRMPAVRAATDGMTIGTGETAVQLYTLPTVHAEGVLAAYVPALRMLYVTDVLTPGPTLAPLGSREVVALVRARNLAVDRVVGGHGGIALWADVERAAR